MIYLNWAVNANSYEKIADIEIWKSFKKNYRFLIHPFAQLFNRMWSLIN